MTMAADRTPRFKAADTVLETVTYRPVTPARQTPPAPPARLPRVEPVAGGHTHARPAAAPRFVEIHQEASVIERMPVQPRMPAPAAMPQHVSLLPARRGELTVVFSCRGGAGATTLAVNTAAIVARGGRSACVLDLDLQLGDVCGALDLAPQTSLSAVAREAHMLDGVSLRRRLAQHSSGVCALAQTGHLDDLDPQLAARMPQLIDTLRCHFDHVVVDGVRDFGDLAIAAIEAATRIVLVVTQDVASVRRAARVLDVMNKLGVAPGRVAVVINRAVRRAAIDDAAISRALGLPIAAQVREDARVGAALDTGALLVDVARSRAIVEDVARVAALCGAGETTANTNAAPKHRWFHFGRGAV
jgi:Flp pilus assembly CpaE family ATPase